jgi:transcriptional regulator with XRE-family HTH domain
MLKEVNTQEVDRLRLIIVKRLAINVKKEREARNISYAEMAFFMKTDKSFIWRIENDPSINPTMTTVLAMCELFNVSLGDLLL